MPTASRRRPTRRRTSQSRAELSGGAARSGALPAAGPRARAGGRPADAPACLGLTGGIGSGKTAALDLFAGCGAAVLSSDAVVHALYARPAVRDAVRERFGDAVLGADGAVDRSLLGPAAFGQEGGIAFLEGLIHPLVQQERIAWLAEQDARRPRSPLLVCEVPLLFEGDLARHFDAVLVVTASPETRRRRVEARGQRFAERSGRQWDEAAKLAAADGSYSNDGSLEELKGWVVERFAEYAGRPCAR